jgi:hypothetical protein
MHIVQFYSVIKLYQLMTCNQYTTQTRGEANNKTHKMAEKHVVRVTETWRYIPERVCDDFPHRIERPSSNL